MSKEQKPKDVLEPGEVIRDEKTQSIVLGGRVYHHVREALDGRWIFAEVKPRD